MHTTKKITATLGLAILLGGCANIPPLIQDHNGNYGLYLPTGHELMRAMLYRQDAKFPVAGGINCVLEHNTLNGHIRLLYPNGSFIAMHGWRDMHYVGGRALPNGQVMGLFIGTLNGQPDTEELILFNPSGIGQVTLGTGGVAYGPAYITNSDILFKQVNAPDPLLRVYKFQSQQLSQPVLQSTVLQREAMIREQQAQAIRQRQAQERRLREREKRARQRRQALLADQLRVRRQAEQQAVVRQQQAQRESTHTMAVHLISIQGGAVSVQSSVPMGHQSIAPQAVNLQ